MERGLRLRVAVAAGGVLLAAVVAPRAQAAAVEESGYWWRFQLGATPASPPGVEEGQLHVAADAVGTSAVSAVRARVAADSVEALVLREVSSSGSPALRACATTGWTAPEGAGSFADRPSDERCTTDVVQGTRDESGAWTFPVASLVTAEGVLDVVIVPGVGDQAVTFAAPDETTLILADAAPVEEEPAGATTGESESDQFAGGGFAGPVADERPSVFENESPSDFAAPISGAPAASFDDDVRAYPAPPVSAAGTDAVQTGERAPLALLAAAIVIGVWVYRARAALAAAGAHPLSAPVGGRAAELSGAAAKFDEVALP